MSRNRSPRIPTDGSEHPLEHAAFASLELSGLPIANCDQPALSGAAAANHATPIPPKPKGGRLEVKREKSGRGGKTVTVIYPFPGMSQAMKDSILRLLKKQLATGGTLSGGNIEIQGDFADPVVRLLSEQGYRAIRAGG